MRLAVVLLVLGPAISHAEDGRPIDPSRDYAAWQALLAEVGLPAVPLHNARHTAATLLLEVGVDAHVVAQILGHSDATTSRGYQSVSLDLARAAMGSLNAMLEAPTSSPVDGPA